MLLLTLLRQSLDDKSSWMTRFCENNKTLSNRLICNYVQQIEQPELKNFLLEIKMRAFSEEVIAIGGPE
jgi:hypothetical protein